MNHYVTPVIFLQDLIESDGVMKTNKKLRLMGCGIFKKEIEWLIAKNHWLVETEFFDSSLHVNFGKLYTTLSGALENSEESDNIVFYGACHPGMDKLLDTHKAIRTPGQNCVDILLGAARFNEELGKGAFFLFEDWAINWDKINKVVFGNNLQIIRNIYQENHKYLLCIRTPCSGDFTQEAEAAGKMIGLPLKWINVTLDHLEQVLKNLIEKKLAEHLNG